MNDQTRQRALALLFDGLPGWILIAIGLMAASVSLVADPLGLGGQPGEIGWHQLAGASLGGLLALAGGWYVASLGRRLVDSRETDALVVDSMRRDGVPFYDSAAPRIPFLHELNELYRYRFLLWNLISRDLKVRYKRSVLGFVWAMVNPLLTMGVLVVVFTRLFRFQIQHYPLYILGGLLLWNLYARGTSVAMRSVLGNSSTRKKIYIPASIFVAAAIGSALLNLLFAIMPLFLLSVIMGVSPKVTWLLIPLPVMQATLFSFGVGLIVAALAVFFADIIDIYEVILRAYFYLTPIIYPISILPSLLYQLEQANPMFHFIDLFRALLIRGEAISLERIILSTLAALAITVAGWSLFTRLSDKFAYRS